ncbi:TetR/AcrR family transcriptional regulator [Actinomadura sp. WMMB 499]|uniref:TetR/AcrR family transcriptional regulator n=1 Tax=Actinomadura sp. WMMB 499 TaxID=1219491 RepID=UPI0020C79E3E|nr:TetR/AcrR family transcriptional regulator [Actinomadura sp. WMMB 499]
MGTAGKDERARTPAGRGNALSAGDDPAAEAIIMAAVDVMARHGYHGTSVRDLAEAAGVSPGLIYHYFGSKHDLLLTILDRGMDRLVESTEEALFHAGDDPADRLCAIVGQHVLAHTRFRRESLLGNTELRSLTEQARRLIVSKRDTQQRMFDRVVRDGVVRGAFGTPHPKEAARMIVTACTAVATWFWESGPMSPDEVAAVYQRMALDTVGHRHDARSAARGTVTGR